MAKKYDFSYIIIGSGPAGSSAALNLTKTKKRIALVECQLFGGTNLNTLDVPASVAFDFAHAFTHTCSYPELKHQDFTFNYPTIIARQYKSSADTGALCQNLYSDANIVCLQGYANFLDDHTIAIDNQKFTSEYFIIATGSQPTDGNVAGASATHCLSPEEALKLPRLPHTIAIVGGGSTGCELAAYFAELGSRIILLEAAPHLLPKEDREASDTLADYFSKHLGITIFTHAKVTAVEQSKSAKSKRVFFRHYQADKATRVDCVILATGSQPVLDLGLENAKVKYQPTGITVNKLFQTSAKHIFAIGDCIGGESSPELADYQGSVLATALNNNIKAIPNYQGFVRTTNTSPMVCSVGAHENDLIRTKRKYKKSLIPLSQTNASKIYGFPYGFVKILTDLTGHILGATIVAPNANYLIREFSLAIRHNITILEIASTPHYLNEFDYAIKLAAKKLIFKRTTQKTKHK